MSSTADTAMSPPDTCAFCKMSGEIANVAGVLERSPDGRVVAHKNCMLYSPKVIMKDPRECGKFRYDIESVVSEIKRGKELPCNRCRKRGATVGCDVKECRRTYHFPCVQEARGSVNRSRFVVFCFEHNNNNANGPKKGQSRKRKRCQKPSDNLRKKIKKQNCNNGVLQNVQNNEQPESSFIIPSNSTVDIEDREVAQPSTSWQCMRSGSVSEESDSLLSPRENTVFSLGVLQNEQTNEQPETILFIPIHSTVEIEDSEDAQPPTSGQCLRPDSGSEESDSSMRPDSGSEESDSSMRPDSGSEESDSSMRPDSGSEESDSSMRPDSGSEESDSSMRPDSGSEESDSSMRPDSGSEESDSLLSPRMIRVFSLSGFPKTKKKYSSNRKPNSQLNEVLGTLSSQDKKVLSQMYSELGGSQQNVDIEMDTDAEIENGQIITDNENDSDVTENSTDRTLDGLPDTIPVNALDHSTEENPFPGEQPNNNISDIISKTPKCIDILASRLSMKAQAQFSESNTRDRSCMRTPDTSSCSSNGMHIHETSKLSNGVMHSVTPDTENIRGANLLGLSKGIRPPSQLIQSNNTKEKLDSEPKSCTDVHKSIGCSLDLHNVTIVEDLGTQGTSEVGPAGCPVTEYEVTSYTPLIQEKEGNREEAYTSVSDWTALSIMDDSPESHCYNGGTFPVASTSDDKTLLNVNRGENKRNIPNFLSPQQITDISKKLVRGDLCKQFKTIVPKIQSAINSPRGYTAKEAEETRDDQAYSERSPNPHTMNQPAENYFHSPLNNQGSSDDPIQNMVLMCHKKSITITSNRQLCYETLTTTNLQQTEENLSEQPEIPEDLDEHRDEELQEEAAPPGSVQCDWAPGHQSGPSSLHTPHHSPFCRSKSLSGSQYGGAGGLDDIDAFGRVVAGQYRLLPQDRQAKFMSYVLATADLFRSPPALPELDILIANLRQLLERSQQVTSYSGCDSSV
ncbi:PHD finger protein 11 isoform X2 [Engystomops pustulosus]|uniref:PHD finger protein 11 isoform X2 n=1 Tax=Engystomops pustulosus TaxID=76066 RepID=UPI003AFA13D1